MGKILIEVTTASASSLKKVLTEHCGVLFDDHPKFAASQPVCVQIAIRAIEDGKTETRLTVEASQDDERSVFEPHFLEIKESQFPGGRSTAWADSWGETVTTYQLDGESDHESS